MCFGYSWSTLLWHRCYYPQRSRDALSPICGIFLLVFRSNRGLLWQPQLCTLLKHLNLNLDSATFNFFLINIWWAVSQGFGYHMKHFLMAPSKHGRHIYALPSQICRSNGFHTLCNTWGVRETKVATFFFIFSFFYKSLCIKQISLIIIVVKPHMHYN